MRMAIDEARQADFPFGAVIVRDGAVIARGRNLGRTTHDPTAHGEMAPSGVAWRSMVRNRSSAARSIRRVEPCAHVHGAIIWCHFGRMVFAASVENLGPRSIRS